MDAVYFIQVQKSKQPDLQNFVDGIWFNSEDLEYDTHSLTAPDIWILDC